MQHKKSAANSPRRFGYNRLTGILAIIFIAAIVISALPSFNANAQGSSYFGLGNLFGLNETTQRQSVIEPTNAPAPFLTPGTCDSGNLIDVEASVGSAPGGFSSLKGAFDAINAGTVGGTVTIEVCGNTTETVAAVLNASGSGSASYSSVTIQPIGGAARIVTGVLSTPLIDLNGADNVTIDGLSAGGNSLTISNTSTSTTASAIRFINDATNNTVQNASILGSETGTTSGVIVFSTTTGTGGNDGNIINNNNIGPAGSGLPTNGIYSVGSVTTATHYNSGIQITNNRIFDIFNVSAASNGIFASTGSSDWTITGNSFYQTGTRTSTSGSTHTAIQVNYSLANNFVISNNTIGGSDATAGGTAWTQAGNFTNRFVGIQFTGGSTTPSSIQNNTIKNFTWSSTSGATTLPGIWIGIYVSAGSVNVGTTTGNTIGATTGTGSVTATVSTTGGTSFGIGSASTGTVAISNNNVGAITLNSSSASVSHSFVGIQTTNGTNTISGNTIGSTTTANSINSAPASTSTTAQTVTGILSSSSTSANISNNIVANLNNNYAGTGTGQIRGIVGTAGVLTITSNTVRNLSTSAAQTSTTTSASVIGISINPSSTSGNTISQNLVHSLSNSAASANVQLTGIFVSPSGSAGNVIERNFVHSISTPSTGAASINGIYAFNGNSTYRNNMVRLGLDAAGNSLTSGSLAINGILADTISASTNNYYHNSIYVGGTGVGAGTTATSAFRRITSDTSNVFNNIFVNNRSNGAGTGKHYIMNIAATTTFNSNYNDFFQNGTGGVFGIVGSTESTTFANWKANTGKDANSFFADPMFINPTGTAADVDLHINPAVPTVIEGTGTDVGVTNDFDGQTRASLTPVDIGADAGDFTSAGDFIAPVVTYTTLANTSSTGDRTLSVTVTDNVGVTAVRIYFKKSTDATFTLAASNACSMTGGTTTNGTYDCVISATALGGVAAGDTIQYFVVAQDAAGNIGSNPAGATGTSVTALTAFPASPNSYTILGTISGNKTVGAGGDYATLTAAIADLNAKELTGTLTLTLTDAAYNTGTGEIFPLTINANSSLSASNTVTIKPATGVSPTIMGSTPGCIINLLGADWVTIDGSNVAGGTSRNLTITNTNAGTSSAVVCLQNTATPDGATNNTVKNTNIVGNSNTTTLFGVFSGSTTIGLSSTGNGNSNNTIQNNGVSKTQYGIFSQGASAASKNTGNTISQNSLDTASPNNIARGGIITGFENNLTVSENSIDGVALNSSPDVFGISLGIQTLGNTTFTGNEVTNATVSRNIVGSVRNTGTFSACGICVAPATSGTNLLVNNMIYGVSANGTSTDFSVGMFIGGGAGSTTNIYFNSISMTGMQTGGNQESYALAIGGSNPIVDIRNNILYNTQDNGTGNNYAIVLGYNSPFTNLTSDYNDFFVTSPSAEHHVGGTGSISAPTNQTTLSSWQTTTGKDANSKNVDPLFTSTTSLFLQFGSPVLDMGTPISGITTDIGGEARQNPPDIGADEITSSAGTFDFNPTTYNVNEGDGTATLTVTRTGGSSAFAVDVTYTLADGTTNPATGGSECPISGTDYVNTGGTVSFGAGETSKTISVPICDDATVESSENFTVTLTGANNSGMVGSNNVATVTIADNDTSSTPGVIEFSMANYTVGESAGTATITVNRTGGDDGTISANYATSNGTATAGTCSLPPLNAVGGAAPDYQSANGTITFTDGDTTPKTFTVTICDDSIDEPDETVNLTLSAGGDMLGGAQTTATLTITDNDEPSTPTVSVDSPSRLETDSSNFNYIVTVSLSAASSQTVSVDFATSDGTATSTGVPPVQDYVTTSGTITFMPGETSKQIQVPVFGDTVPEADETFFVTLSNPVNATISGTNPGTATILNDDTYPTVQFSSATYTTTEALTGAGEQQLGAAGATITVTRSGNTSGTSSVNYATSDGTATGGAACGGTVDYISTSGTLNFAANETSKTFFVQTCFDSTPESNETVNLTLSEPVLATLGTPNTAVLTINDNDTPPPATTVQFDAATYETDEGDDIIIVNVTRSGDTSGSSSVNYATSNGTATGGSCQSVGFDYQSVNGTLSFGPGDTANSFSFEICSDTQSENPPETVNLTLSSPSGATLGTQSTATVNIIDAATQFRNPNPVSIPELTPLLTENFVGQASTSVVVSGAGTNPSRVRVTLFGFTHATPDDIDALLVSPTGQKFVLVGDAGGATAANNVTLTFEDAATTPLPDATALASGNYKPANHEAVPDFFAPAPAGPYTEPGTNGTAAALNTTFSGNPNGTWTLYLRDDTVNGNTGMLAGGFGLEFLAPSSASVNITGRVTRANGQGLSGVVVSLTNAGVGGRRYAITSSFGYYTFEGVTAGDVYIISATSKRYTFNPSSHVITVQDDVADLNFVAEQ